MVHYAFFPLQSWQTSRRPESPLRGLSPKRSTRPDRVWSAGWWTQKQDAQGKTEHCSVYEPSGEIQGAVHPVFRFTGSSNIKPVAPTTSISVCEQFSDLRIVPCCPQTDCKTFAYADPILLHVRPALLHSVIWCAHLVSAVECCERC